MEIDEMQQHPSEKAPTISGGELSKSWQTAPGDITRGPFSYSGKKKKLTRESRVIE